MRKFEILSKNTILEKENQILSKRELEVLLLLAAGFENRQIAKIFYVTLSTIKKQLEKIYQKLNAKNRANAIFIAYSLGIISMKDYKTVITSPRVSEFISICKKFTH